METAIRQTKTTAVIGGFVLWAGLLVCYSFGMRWYAHLTHQSIESQAMFFYSRCFFWVMVGIMYWYSVRVEWQPMLLWPDRIYKFDYGLLSVVAILAVIYVSLIAITIPLKHFGLVHQSKIISHINTFGKPLKFLAVITAAVTEELLFRGYLMPRLQLFFKSAVWPITITTLIFGLGHASYGTLVNVVGPLVIGLVFALHYNKYRNIKLLIICHFIIDFTALMFT